MDIRLLISRRINCYSYAERNEILCGGVGDRGRTEASGWKPVRIFIRNGSLAIWPWHLSYTFATGFTVTVAIINYSEAKSAYIK